MPGSMADVSMGGGWGEAGGCGWGESSVYPLPSFLNRELWAALASPASSRKDSSSNASSTADSSSPPSPGAQGLGTEGLGAGGEEAAGPKPPSPAKSPASTVGSSVGSSSLGSAPYDASSSFADVVPFPFPPRRNVFIEPGSGMRDVPMWLKTLRLHKYTSLFQQISYDDMLSLNEALLEAQGVTKGARHKIVVCVAKLKERGAQLRALEAALGDAPPSALRPALGELKGMVCTPIRPFPPPGRPEPYQSRIDGIDVPADELDDENLPAHFTRVLGKLATAVFAAIGAGTLAEGGDELFPSLLHVLDRCLNHEAFTQAQKRRVLNWKHIVKRVWHPPPRRFGFPQAFPCGPPPPGAFPHFSPRPLWQRRFSQPAMPHMGPAPNWLPSTGPALQRKFSQGPSEWAGSACAAQGPSAWQLQAMIGYLHSQAQHNPSVASAIASAYGAAARHPHQHLPQQPKPQQPPQGLFAQPATSLPSTSRQTSPPSLFSTMAAPPQPSTSRVEWSRGEPGECLSSAPAQPPTSLHCQQSFQRPPASWSPLPLHKPEAVKPAVGRSGWEAPMAPPPGSRPLLGAGQLSSPSAQPTQSRSQGQSGGWAQGWGGQELNSRLEHLCRSVAEVALVERIAASSSSDASGSAGVHF